jgi:hypothetical protein
MSENRPKKLAAGEKRAAKGAGLSEAADESPNFRRVRWRSPNGHTQTRIYTISAKHISP